MPWNAPVPFAGWVTLSAILFTIGAVGVLIRRDPIIMFMCIELMLNAGNLLFIAASRYLGIMDGQVYVFFVMAVAAAEVAVGLGIIVTIFRNRATIDVDVMNEMRG
ncbi:MAG: NADH-quinone oxidoreductase subunit NuoK [Veillonellaceae bacterium]|nr:NADH-quinone oxidoreductase subunit NuoK [Veillonellaceae bacterium]